MNIKTKDLKPLRFPALTLVVAAVFAFLLISHVEQKSMAAADRLRAAQSNSASARQRYSDSDMEKAMISEYLPQYRNLQHQGFIGTENRVSWIDALRIADQQSGNFGVQYRLSAQIPYQGALASEPIGEQLRQSTMEIRFGVVHEGQFLNFLNMLEEQNAGLYTLRSCSLEPRNAEKPQPRTPNLNAHCKIDWVTLVPPGAESS